MFGWQLAAAALSRDQLDAGCDDISSLGHGRWFAEGLVPENIRLPICNASSSSLNASTALPYVYIHGTEVFVTQLLNAFAPGNSTPYDYLCENLRFLSLDSFRLKDARVVNATCGMADRQQQPRPEGPMVVLNTNATAAYTDAISTLFGLMFASSATTDSQLDIYCAHVPEYVPALDAMLLNGALVASTICNTTVPLTVAQSTEAIRTWASKAFAIAIAGSSNVSGWMSWLCTNLDAESLNSVGLDGKAISADICGDADTSSGRK